MNVPTPRIKLTYRDYANTPDDERYELLDGELIRMPSPAEIHQRVSILLGWKLIEFVTATGLGRVYQAPFDVVLSDTDVVQPDLVFISNERAHVLTAANVRGAPDLVVEILSPSSAERDRSVKRALYARRGVKEYWIVDTEARTVAVLLLQDGGFEAAATYGEGNTLTSPTLRGFALPVADLFQ